jgi:hypothetical protein
MKIARFGAGAFIAVLSLAASPATASVTIGQLAPSQPMTACPGVSVDRLQPTVTDGNTYVVPGNGTITSWSTNFAAGNQTMRMEIFRQVAGLRYRVVAHEGPHPLTGGALNTFPASIEVIPGDVLGLHHSQGMMTICPFFFAPGDQILSKNGNLADGEEDDFQVAPVDRRLNITAEFLPSNGFTLGATTRDKKRGTATLAVSVPNPGELTGSGDGVQAAGAAVTSKTVSAPGTTELQINATGRKKKKLKRRGKVTLNITVTYTPTGGDPSQQSTTVKLKKKRKKKR